MKKRIYLNLSLLASISVLCASMLLVVIFYNFYINEQKQPLKDHAHIMVNILENLDIDELGNITNEKNLGYRITIIEDDGKVIFDSSVDPRYLENHIDREEIKDVLERGYGNLLDILLL